MRLCLISMDAVARPDADRLFRLPALSALREESAFCPNVQTVYPTVTYPIHASILTGCYPDRTGIGHNKPFQPDTPHDLQAWYWDYRAIRERTLLHAAREKRMDIASILWPVTGKCPLIRRNFPEILPLPGENAALKMLRYGSPLWILNMELRYGKRRGSILQPDLDEYAVLLAEKLFASRRPPEVFLLHLVDCDAMRHRYGADSPEAAAAMERLDRHVGRVYRAVEKAGLMEDTLFCVVSDHGQQNVSISVPLDAELKKACGARAQGFGMGAYIFSDDLPAARAALDKHRQEWRIAHIYDEAELRALHAPREAHLAVEAMPGAHFTEHDSRSLGEHGFAVTAEESRVLFLLKGPGIAPGAVIPRMRVVDIAPTLAALMGLSLPDTDGTPVAELIETAAGARRNTHG